MIDIVALVVHFVVRSRVLHLHVYMLTMNFANFLHVLCLFAVCVCDCIIKCNF